MEVNSIDYTFSQLKIKLSEEMGTLVPSVIEYKYPGAKKLPAQYPIVLTALSGNQYFRQREKFSIYGLIFGNPMALMVIFSLAVVVFMPMMLNNMDPEELKQLQQQNAMAGGGDPMATLQNLLSGQAPKPANDDDD